MSDHENTEQVVGDHAADAAAHHDRPNPGKNMTEDANGNFNVPDMGASAASYIYARNDGNGKFMRYDIAADTWASLSNGGSSDGGDPVKGDDGYIYSHNQTNGGFQRYDISADSWDSTIAATGMTNGANITRGPL